MRTKFFKIGEFENRPGGAGSLLFEAPHVTDFEGDAAWADCPLLAGVDVFGASLLLPQPVDFAGVLCPQPEDFVDFSELPQPEFLLLFGLLKLSSTIDSDIVSSSSSRILHSRQNVNSLSDSKDQ